MMGFLDGCCCWFLAMFLRNIEWDLTDGPLMSVYLGTFQHAYCLFVHTVLKSPGGDTYF